MANYFLLSFIFIFGAITDPHTLVKTKIAPGIRISIPQALSAMSPESVLQRYPSVRNPLGAFTNDDQTIDFSVNISATQWPDTDLELAREFFKSSVYNLYDRVDWISDGTYKVRGKRYVYLEFYSAMRGKLNKGSKAYYTYVQYLIESDRTLAFTFSCIKSLTLSWQPTAHDVMKSIRVK